MNQDLLAIRIANTAIQMLPDYGPDHGRIAGRMAMAILRIIGLDRWRGVAEIVLELAETGDTTRARRRWPAARRAALESPIADESMAREILFVAQAATTLDLIRKDGLLIASDMLLPAFGNMNAALYHLASACIDEPFSQFWNSAWDNGWMTDAIHRFAVDTRPIIDAAIDVLETMNAPYVTTSLADALVFSNAIDAVKKWAGQGTECGFEAIKHARKLVLEAKTRIQGTNNSMHSPRDVKRLTAYHAMEAVLYFMSAPIKGRRFNFGLEMAWSYTHDDDHMKAWEMQAGIIRSHVPCPLPSKAIEAARCPEFRQEHPSYIYEEKVRRRRR